MSKAELEHFEEHTDNYGNVDKDFLKCISNGGSVCESNGYGCFTSYKTIKSARIVHEKYTKNLLDNENLQTEAYYLGEKDGFQNNEDHYWNEAVKYMNFLRLLETLLHKEKRKENLCKELKKNGMSIRSDSKMCENYINGYNDSIEDVVRTMAECKWCIEYNDMFERMKEYMKDSSYSREIVFCIVKYQILYENPLPEPYPWMVEH